MSSNQSRTEHGHGCVCSRCEGERKIENREESEREAWKRERDEWSRP